MTKEEIKVARKLLDAYATRTETIGLDNGGYAVTAYYRNAGQKIFYALDHLKEFIAEREQAAAR